MNRKTRIISAALCAAALTGGTAHAISWDGDAGDGVWTNVLNWDTDTLPTSADLTYIETGDTVSYTDGMTNTVNRHVIRVGSTLNFTGGSLNSSKSGNTVREIIGGTSGHSYLNQSGGLYQSGHIMRIGIGGEGTVNLSGGTMYVYRGGNSSFGNPGVSVSIGNSTGLGALNITNSTFATRTGVEIGENGTFNVYGAASSISLGGQGGDGDGDWFQSSNGVLRVGISADGVSTIVCNDTDEDGVPTVTLDAGSILDVSFVDGANEVGYWPVLDGSSAAFNNLGMVFADSVDTNDWGYIVSNNVLYVGYGLGWPAGEDIVGPPSAGRTLYWTGAAGTTASDNATNWVLDTDATLQATWGPYDGDYWKIADSSVTGIEAGTNYVVDYDGTAVVTSHQDLDVGSSAIGTFNMNSGDLSFTKTSSSRQEFGNGSGGYGTLNVNGGNLYLNAARFGTGGADGTLNLNSGTLYISRAYGDYSLWLGHGGTSNTGAVTVAGGRMYTRVGVKLGDGDDIGIFTVEGSEATTLSIGGKDGLDGQWIQNSGSILSFKMDADGVTPITVVNQDEGLNGKDGDVYFNTGSVLDLGWMAGVTNYGVFDVMTWEGTLVESNLTFASSVDTNIWSFEFVDNGINSNGVDTLRVTAYGETANGTPYPWLIEHGLSGDDDEVDNDGDGLLTYEEYLAGTNPTNAASVLAITSGQQLDADNFVITWQSVSNRTYMIQTNTSLTVENKGTVATGIAGEAGETSYTGSISGAGTVFYEVGVE